MPLDELTRLRLERVVAERPQSAEALHDLLWVEGFADVRTLSAEEAAALVGRSPSWVRRQALAWSIGECHQPAPRGRWAFRAADVERLRELARTIKRGRPRR